MTAAAVVAIMAAGSVYAVQGNDGGNVCGTETSDSTVCNMRPAPAGMPQNGQMPCTPGDSTMQQRPPMPPMQNGDSLRMAPPSMQKAE